MSTGPSRSKRMPADTAANIFPTPSAPSITCDRCAGLPKLTLQALNPQQGNIVRITRAGVDSKSG
jgi:hypothetical protein